MIYIVFILVLIMAVCIWYIVNVDIKSGSVHPDIPRLQRKLKIEGDFKPDLYYFDGLRIYLGFQHNNKKLKIFYNDSRFADMTTNFDHYITIIDYKDIISAEIVEDNMLISKTNRKSQLIGAGIGGMIAGGTGAIIGGLSGKSSTTNEVQNVTLRMIVNNFSKPVYDIPFLNLKDSVKKTDSQYKNAIDLAYSWHNVISKIIKDEVTQQSTILDNNENRDDISKRDDSSSTNHIDYIKEIERLASLKNKGIIDENEFKKLKSKLINS